VRPSGIGRLIVSRPWSAAASCASSALLSKRNSRARSGWIGRACSSALRVSRKLRSVHAGAAARLGPGQPMTASGATRISKAPRRRAIARCSVEFGFTKSSR